MHRVGFMKKENKTSPENEKRPDSPGQFFRELEIEFLIHELKDPIAIVETGARTLLERPDKFGSLTEKQEKTLQRMLRNTKRARGMLYNLLEIGRSQEGISSCCLFHPAKCIYEVLIEALETISGSIPEEARFYQEKSEAEEFLSSRDIYLNTPPDTLELKIFQDEIKFRQIVGNLIKNALHHRKDRIDINFAMEGNSLNVEVVDDGAGVDPKHHNLIFQRYAQTDACAIVERKGHGLGLAGALIQARCLGGNIEIDSRKGRGATFRLTLPVTAEDLT